MKLLWLLVPLVILVGCSSQPSYSETLEKWQAEKDKTAITELQKEYTEVSKALADIKAAHSQQEADNKNLKSQIDNLQQVNQGLQSELSERPATDDIMRISKAMQDQANQYDVVSKKFIELMSMWQQLKIDYKALKVSFRDAVATGNFTDNQTRDYLEIIKVIE